MSQKHKCKKTAQKYKIKNICNSIDDLFTKTASKLLIVAVSEMNIKKVMLQL